MAWDGWIDFLTPAAITGGIIAGSRLLLALAALYLFGRRGESAARAQLRAEIAAHRQTLDELRDARRQLVKQVSERKADENQLRLVLGELTHRSKNLLTVIHAIARQTASRTRSVDDFLDGFGARLQAIGSSHDLLIADNWQGASLRMLVEQQLEAQSQSFGGRIAIDGEDVMLKPEAVHNLGLALHELTTNAEKYGALSNAKGEIRVDWKFCDDAGELKFVWQERGGPAVSPPERSGFGRAMIENVVGKALEGDVTLSFPAEGVRCEIVISAAQITSRG
jgi:two-component sensor histidine kinase